MILNKQKSVLLSYEEKCSWLRLIRSENVSDAVFWQLLKRYGSPQNALQVLPILAKKGGMKAKIKIAELSTIEQELEEATENGIEYIFAGQENYPALLYQMPYSPPVLAIYGNIAQLTKPTVALVGSRRATNAGLQLSASFAEHLGEAGFTIISGFASGIDTAAHRAAVKTGTVVVLAGGAGHIYPQENYKLYHEIIDNNGLIISEHSFNYTPTGADFPKRNRIVAGLSLGLVVIEATRRSGTLITARLAVQYNRLVFATPQNLLHPQTQGNNDLLKSGAMVATSPQDVIECLLPLSAKPLPGQLYLLESESTNLVPTEPIKHKENDLECDAAIIEKVLNNLTYSGINIKTLAFLTQTTIEEVKDALLILELAGKITRRKDGSPALRILL